MRVLLESRHITAKEADDLVGKWASQSLRVCFAVCLGDFAWHTQWVGPVQSGLPGRWIQIVDQMTNVLCTDQYQEIILMEDEHLLGIRFRNPKGLAAVNFEVNLFIHKLGNIDNESASLLTRMIH
jgi:hypothetical protein